MMMYGYKWTDNYNIFKLDVTNQLQKELRPVFKEELDFFGMQKYWDYPDVQGPILWAEGIRKYILNGECIAEAKGGGFYSKPVVEIKNHNIKTLAEINLNDLVSKNDKILEGLIQRSISFIRQTYEQYSALGYTFVVAFSGGKDSLVLLDLVQRALAPDQFVVVFSDTGMELSSTYQSVENSKKQWPNLRFYTAKSTFTANDSWNEFGPPGRRLRWCCAVHKSVPTLLLLRELTGDSNMKAVVFDGVRAEESEQRSTYLEVSEGKKHIHQVNCSPILTWNTAELYIYIFKRGILLNSAYRHGLFRVGCTVCPMSSSWWDGIANSVYHEELKPLLSCIEKYAKETKPEKEWARYIEQGGWKGRFGGRGLPNGGNRVHEVIEGNAIKFILSDLKQAWIDVARLLGPITERNSDGGQQIINGKTYTFIIEDNGQKITYSPYEQMDRYTKSWLRGIANKVTYCVGCNLCTVECPTGAFLINENHKIRIDTEKCVHCGVCISSIAKGCSVARSLSTTKGGSAMDLKGLNRYQHFGLRSSWIEHFFEEKNNCWSTKELGNKQYDALKVYLREAGILETNSRGDKSGQITPLGEKLVLIGPYHPLTWAIIWNNLAYNSTLMMWYLLNVAKGEIFDRNELIDMVDDIYAAATRANAISSLTETFLKSPIGNTLEMGVAIQRGNTTSFLKKGWSNPEDLAILYALYLYAEKLSHHYDFTLTELKESRLREASTNLILDPATIFAVDDDIFKEMIRQLANHYPDFISIAFVADLDNIKLNNQKTSLDVVDLALGGK